LVGVTHTRSRQREIIEVLFRNGWDYMRQLLLGTQAGQPELPPPKVLRKILIDLGPVYVKLGQLLSTRPDLLPDRYIEVLTTLQASVPPVNWVEIAVMLRQQLHQPVHEIFTQVSPQAVAAGSIAQVHRATLLNGREVALKIQRPGIEATVLQDIRLLRGMAKLLATTEFGQRYNTISLADEVANALQAELNFCREANYCDQLRRNLAASSWFEPDRVLVPEILWELTTEKLMVMEWLDGVPLLSATLQDNGNGRQNRDANGERQVTERQSMTTLLFRAFFQQIFFDGFFHADPHPGNLLYVGDGRIALLDFGLVGRLDPKTQQVLTEIALAVVNTDAARCSQLTLQLAENSDGTDPEQLERDYSRLMGKYRNLNLAQVRFSQLICEMMAIIRDRNLKMPGNMALYAKTLANLEGVVRQLNPDVNLVEEARPLMGDLFRQKLVSDQSVPAALTTALDLQRLLQKSPRQLQLLLERLTAGKLKFHLGLKDVEHLHRTLNSSANRLSFSIVVGALILGAAIVATHHHLSLILFALASLLGFWLLLSIMRSGKLK